MKHLKIVLCLAAVTMITAQAAAQQERKFIRRGNRDFKKENFNDAEINYMRALEIDSASVAAKYNLSSALYKMERFDDALAIQNAIAADSTQNAVKTSDLQFNTGNTYFEKKDYAKAIEQYKRSLRANPDDYEAKYNLAYAQLMQQQQEQQDQNDQQQNGGDNNDQNKDQNKDNNPQDDKNGQQDQNGNPDQQDNQNGKDDQNKGNPDQQDQNPDNKNDGQPQPQDGQITKQEAEQFLKAIQNNEDKTQEKIKEQKAKGAVVKGKKNW